MSSTSKTHRKADRKAWELSSRPHVGFTGFADGDILVGLQSKNASAGGGVLRVFRRPKNNGVYLFPPSTRFLDTIRNSATEWRQFLNQMLGTSIYQHLHTIEQMDAEISRVEDSVTPSHENIGAKTDLVFQVLLPPNQYTTGARAVEDHVQKQMVSPNPNSADGFWTIEELLAFMPALPGSESEKKRENGTHTLAWRRSQWTRASFASVPLREFSGKILVAVDRGEVYDVSQCRPSAAGEARAPSSPHTEVAGADQVLVLRRSSGRVGLWLPPARTPRPYPSVEEWFSGKLLHVPGEGGRRSLVLNPGQLGALASAFRFAGTREFKSMLQKIVRERPKMCWLLTTEDTLGVSTRPPHSHSVDMAVGGQCLPADLVLAYVVVRMADPSQPGQFMPDLGVFVPALVSLLKRLAVIAWEDSAPAPDHLITLLSAAMVAREMPIWRPSVQFVARVVAMAVRMYACKQRCEYDIRRGSVVLKGNGDALCPTHTLTTAHTMIEIASAARKPVKGVKGGDKIAVIVAAALLKDLRSFESDMAMAIDIGHQWPKSIVTPKSVPQMEKIPFPDHGLDQHVFLGATAMAFLAPVWLRRKRKCSKWPTWSTKRAHALLAQLMATGAKTGKQSTPYARFLSLVFSAVTGHNPRRTATVLDPEIEPSSDAGMMLLATRYAQQTLRLLFWRRAHDAKRNATQSSTNTKKNSTSSDSTEPPAGKRVKIEREGATCASSSANKKSPPSAAANEKSVLEMNFELPRAYLASLIGVLEIGKMPHAMRKVKGKKKPNPPMMVTLNPSNILDFVAIRKPARGATDETLQDEELQDWAKERAKTILAKGVPLTAAKAPHSTLARCKAKLILSADPAESSSPSPPINKPGKRSRGVSGSGNTKASPNTVAREAMQWTIVYPNGDQKSWDEARCVSSTFRLVALTTPTESTVLPPPLAMMQAAITNHHTDVVAKDAPMLLRKLCTRFKMREILRAISLLSHCRQQFRFPLVNRGGGGLAEQVVACDHGAFEFLMSLSALYPAALQPSPTRPFDFVVPHLPLMWHVRAELKAIVAGDNGHPSSSDVASTSATLSPRTSLHAAEIRRLVALAKDLVSRMREAVSSCQPSDQRSVKNASGALMRIIARTDRQIPNTVSESTLKAVLLHSKIGKTLARVRKLGWLHGRTKTECTAVIKRFKAQLKRSKTEDQKQDSPKPSAWPPLKDKRVLREHQDAAVTEMQAAHDAGVMGHFLWGTVGIGKTLIVAKFMDWLRSRNVLAPVVLWVLPKSAMLGVINELKGEGRWEVDILVPKRRDDREYRAHVKAGARVFWKGQLRMRPRVVTMVEHDSMRSMQDILLENNVGEGSRPPFVVFDEVHKMFNTGTQRTAMALELARLSSGFVALTGTPIVDSRAYTLMTWLELVVPFEVNKRNFWVAANSMVAKLVATGVIVQREEVEVRMSPAQLKRYQCLVQPRHGGHEHNDSSEYSYHEAATLGYEVCEAAMVAKTFDIVSKSPPQHRLDPGLKKGAQVRFQSDGDESFRLGKISDNSKLHQGTVCVTDTRGEKFEVELARVRALGHVIRREGVMLVAKGLAMQARIARSLVTLGVRPGDILCLGGSRDGKHKVPHGVATATSVYMSAKAVREDGHPYYSVVITPQRMCEGYSVTALTHCLRTVYPSNQAVRDQLEGRINRICQEAPTIKYWIFHSGILTWIHKHHNTARNLRIALQDVGTTYTAEDLIKSADSGGN